MSATIESQDNRLFLVIRRPLLLEVDGVPHPFAIVGGTHGFHSVHIFRDDSPIAQHRIPCDMEPGTRIRTGGHVYRLIPE